MGMKWYLIVALIGISLMIGGVEHLFTCLLAFLVNFFFKAEILSVTSIFFFNFWFIYLFIYLLFMAVLGLCFYARAFSSYGRQGPLFIAVRGPLTIVASLVAEHRLQTRRLSNCGSRA